MITITNLSVNQKEPQAVVQRTAEIEAFMTRHESGNHEGSVVGDRGDLDHGMSPWDFTFQVDMGLSLSNPD